MLASQAIHNSCTFAFTFCVNATMNYKWLFSKTGPSLDATHRSSWCTWLRQRWASRSGRIPGRTWQPWTSWAARSPWPDWPMRSLAVCLLCQPGVETQKRQRDLGDRPFSLLSSILGEQPTNELSVAVNQELFLLRFETLTSAWEVWRDVCSRSEYLHLLFVCCHVCVLFMCLFLYLVEWMSFFRHAREASTSFVFSQGSIHLT